MVPPTGPGACRGGVDRERLPQVVRHDCEMPEGIRDDAKQVTGNVNLEPQSKAEARDRSLERAWSLRGM